MLRLAVTLLVLTLCGQVQAQCPAGDAALRPLMPGLAVRDGLWPSANLDGVNHWASTVVLWQANRVTVLDPGPTRCAGEQLQRALEAKGHGRVERLINSHAHAEQVLANVRWSAPVAATATTQSAMHKRCPDCLAALRRDLGPRALRGTRIVLPTQVLHDGDVLQAGGRAWQVMDMPMAHTESDLVLWSASDRVVLVGGLVDGHQLVLAQGRVEGWLQALQRISALKADWLVGQHRVAQGAHEVAQALAQQQAALCHLVRHSWQGLEQGLTEAESLARLAPEGGAAAQRQQRFNLLRAWREMEARWLTHEPMPSACADQPQTSEGS